MHTWLLPQSLLERNQYIIRSIEKTKANGYLLAGMDEQFQVISVESNETALFNLSANILFILTQIFSCSSQPGL
jgi:hypothetical protein